MGIFFGSKDAGDSPWGLLPQIKNCSEMQWWAPGTPVLMEALKLLDRTWLSALENILEKSYKGMRTVRFSPEKMFHKMRK